MDEALSRAIAHLEEAQSIAFDLGLAPDTEGTEQRSQSVQIRISELEPTKTTVISNMLSRASFFDEMVREYVAQEGTAAEHLRFAESLDRLVALIAPLAQDAFDGDGHDAWRAAGACFGEMQEAYEPIGAAVLQGIERGHVVQEAYREFRLAMKEGEAIGLELLETAFARYNTARQKVLEEESGAGDGATPPLIERLRQLQDDERRWGVARDVANRLTSAGGDADIVMGRLTQSTSTQERLYWQSQAFVGAVSTLIDAFPRALDEDPERRVECVGELLSAIVLFQQRTRDATEELERLAAESAEEISELQLESQHRLERLTPARVGA